MPDSISLSAVAKKNIQRNPGRSFCLIVVVMLLSLFLFVGTVLISSLSGGAASVANRLGADIMIVPEGFDPHVDSILLSGKPSTFYLPSYAFEELEKIKNDVGIEAMSAQTFLATLNASCCSYPVQLVGIDFDSDFIVKPWLEISLGHELHDGEIIVGYHVAGYPGDTLQFFSKNLNVAGRLEQTGMGFDSMIFMNRATIAVLAKEAERIRERPLKNDGSLTSVIMLKLKPGFSSTASAIEINRLLNKKGIYALFSKKFVNRISASLITISKILSFSLIALWLLAIVIVALIFSLSLSERKKEMGVLRALGASRGILIKLNLTEAFFVSFYGAVLGVTVGSVLITVFSPGAVEALNMPFLLPSKTKLILLAVISDFAAVVTGVIAALWASVKASRVDVHEIMR